MRAVGGLDARVAVELAQDVADVHVDRARAEEQLLGDVAMQQNITDYVYWFHQHIDYRTIKKA